MSEENKEPQAQPSPADPKMILKELDKSAAAEASPVPPELKPVEPEPAPVPMTFETPLVSEAMRRLDDLLARFRK